MYKLFKRIIDFLIALVGLIILFPFMIPIIIGLLLTGEGYVFYLQKRVGYKNKIFKIFKFATMLKNSPNMEGGLITTKKDPRITPMGGILRKTKINEVPQLANILLGDMSLVGPRPVMQKSFEQYPPDVQDVIYNVKPGLTGIGSIIFRDEEELITNAKNEGKDTWEYYKNVIYPYKGMLEKWYQKKQSFWVDLKIIIATVWVVFFPDSQITYKLFPSIPKRQF